MPDPRQLPGLLDLRKAYNELHDLSSPVPAPEDELKVAILAFDAACAKVYGEDLWDFFLPWIWHGQGSVIPCLLGWGR